MPASEGQHRVIGGMLGVSVALHLAFIFGLLLRISPSYQAPLASYEVALVSLHQAQPRLPAEPVLPVQPARPLPDSPKPATPIEAQSPSRSASAVREALRGLELPPEAPTLTESVPAASTAPKRSTKNEPKRLREELDTLMAKLAVPNAPSSPATAKSPPPSPQAKPALSEELRKQLQDLQHPVPTEPELPPAPPDARPAQPERTAPAAALPKKPTTSINVPGAAPGITLYLAQVQNKISSYWVAPNVGDFRQLEGLHVTVKFRLHRTGKVTDVTIEESSGNEYYDLSGKRAVLSADPLPPFPRGMSEPHFDAHFRFVLGEKAG